MKQNFRAWKKKEKKMIQPKCLMAIGLQTEVVVEQIESGDFLVPYSIPFEDVKIMQTTGTLDKNNKEIFEGDVLRIDFIKAIVRFGQYRYYDNAGKDVLTGNGFYLECLNVMDPDCISPYETDVLDKAEIIGNIYENPEYDQNFVGFTIKGEK